MKTLIKEALIAVVAIACVLNSPVAYAANDAAKHISALEKLDGVDRQTALNKAAEAGKALIEYAQTNPAKAAAEITAELKKRGYTDAQIAKLESMQAATAQVLSNPDVSDDVKVAHLKQMARDVSLVLQPATASASMECPEAWIFLGGLVGGVVLVIVGAVKDKQGATYAGVGGLAAAAIAFWRMARGYCG